MSNARLDGWDDQPRGRLPVRKSSRRALLAAPSQAITSIETATQEVKQEDDDEEDCKRGPVRTPGDYLPDAIGLSYGFDLYEAVVRLSLGRTPPELPHEPVSWAATVFPTAPPGTIRAITGVRETEAQLSCETGYLLSIRSLAPGSSMAA